MKVYKILDYEEAISHNHEIGAKTWQVRVIAELVNFISKTRFKEVCSTF